FWSRVGRPQPGQPSAAQALKRLRTGGTSMCRGAVPSERPGGHTPPFPPFSHARYTAGLPCHEPRRMNPNFLDFEQPIAELEAKIEELRHTSNGQALNIDEEVGRLREKLKLKTNDIFKNLSSWQIAQLSRHPARPYTLDYIGVMCEEFHELAGDRMYADDGAIVGGLGRINGRAVMIVGHKKARDTKGKLRRNFGMPRPEGYRKALRLMKMAERS